MKNTNNPYKVTRFPYLPLKQMEYVAEITMKYAPKTHLLELPAYLTSAYLHYMKTPSDITHTHLAIPLGFLAANNPRKIPQVITCHGSDLTYPLEKPLYRPFTRNALQKADFVVTVSDYTRKIALSLGAQPEKTQTIYLGVDTRYFKPHKRNKTLTIGTLGRIVEQKRIQDILIAAKHLENKIDFKLLIGGDGPYLPFLKRLATSLELNSVKFLGRINNPVSFHNLCDVFILASVREGLSISLQEAMSCESVPVAVNGYGCRELIKQNENGILYNPRDKRDLSQKILLATDNIWMGKQARKTIVKNFNADKNAVKYLEIYNRVGHRF